MTTCRADAHAAAKVPGEPSNPSVDALELRGEEHYVKSQVSAKQSQWEVRLMTNNNRKQTA